jgi:hypothetical protein
VKIAINNNDISFRKLKTDQSEKEKGFLKNNERETYEFLPEERIFQIMIKRNQMCCFKKDFSDEF